MKSNLLFIFVLCFGYVHMNFGAILKDENPLKPVEKVIETKIDGILPSKTRDSDEERISLMEAVDVMFEKMGNSNPLAHGWPNLVKLKETLLSNKFDAELNIFDDVKDVILGNTKSPERRECLKQINAKIDQLQQGIKKLRQRKGPGVARDEYGIAHLNSITKVSNSEKYISDMSPHELITFLSKKHDSENQMIADMALSILKYVKQLLITEEPIIVIETEDIVYKVTLGDLNRKDKEKYLNKVEKLIKSETGAIHSDQINSNEEEGIPLKDAVDEILHMMDTYSPINFSWPNLVELIHKLSNGATIVQLKIYDEVKNVIIHNTNNSERKECKKLLTAKIRQLHQDIRQLRQQTGPGIARNEYGNSYLNLMTKVTNSPKNEVDITLPEFIKNVSKKLNSENQDIADMALTTLQYLRELITREDHYFYAETENVIYRVLMDYPNHIEDKEKCLTELDNLIEFEQGDLFSDQIFSDEEEEEEKEDEEEQDGIPIKDAVRYTLELINIDDPFEYAWPDLMEWREMVFSDQSTTVQLKLNIFNNVQNVILGKPHNPERRECLKQIDTKIEQIQQNIQKLRQRKGPGVARDEYGHILLNLMSRGTQESNSAKKETDITLPQFIKFLSKKNSASPLILNTLKYLRKLLSTEEPHFLAETDNVICKVSMFDLSQEDKEKYRDEVEKLIQSKTNKYL